MKLTTQLPIPPAQGAAAGIVDPGELAKSIGFMPHGAFLFAYMFRRFGPPNLGSDDYKNLASWCLTTPLKGCFLTVTPYMADFPAKESHHTLSFGYFFETEIEKRAQTAPLAERRAWNTWQEKTLKWAFKRGLSIVTATELDNRKPLNKYPYGKEEGTKYHIVWTNAADKNRRVELSRTYLLKIDSYHFIRGDINSAYRKAHPRGKVPQYPRENPSVIARINRALIRTLTELQRPVMIRDIAITPNGRYENYPTKTAPAYEHAGYPCIPDLPEEMKLDDPVHAEIIRRHLKPGDTLTHTRCMGIVEEHIYTGMDGPWLCGKPTRDTRRISPCATYAVNDIAVCNITHINRVPILAFPEFEEFQKETRRRRRRLLTLDQWAALQKSGQTERYDDDIPF